MPKPKKKLPEFTEEEQDWVARALVVMPPKTAVGAFLDTFPHFYQHGLNRGEVKERMYTRLKQAGYDKSRPLYKRIQDNKEELHTVLRKYTSCFPVLDPLERLKVLEEMRQNPDKINTKLLRVMEIGAKIFGAQVKIDRTKYGSRYHTGRLVESEEEDAPYNPHKPDLTD